MKKGDAVKMVAQPVARGIDFIFGTDVQNCTGCNKMVTDLNAGASFADAFYDRFWGNKEQEEK